MTRRNRPLVMVTVGLLVVSNAFPVAAGILIGPAPRWMGLLDVVVAFALVCAGIGIAAKVPAGFSTRVIEASFRIYRSGSTLFLALLVVFFLVGDSIKWSILLPGLAWRAWLVAWVLPAALALWRGESDRS
jgi:hypothetical protein